MPYKDKNKKKENGKRYYKENFVKIAAQKLIYSILHKNEKSEYDKKYREENKDKIKSSRSGYYQKHKQEHDERTKTWTKNNRAKHTSTTKKWLLANPGKVDEYNHKRRSLKLSSPGNGITAKEWNDLLEKYGGRCLACGSTTNITLDHVIPLISGGANDISNVQPLCKSCNSKKWKRIIDYRPSA
jgi:5-methylcytosine-specific restriction endonuclease McrA